MTQSSLTTYVNGKIHSTSSVTKAGDFYTVNHEGELTKRLKRITYSSAMLYFSEPKGLNSIFSEFECVDNVIKSIGENEYQVKKHKKWQHKMSIVIRMGY